MAWSKGLQISVTDAKAQLTELVRRAEKGDEIVLTRHGHAVVRLVPIKAALDRKSRRTLLQEARAAGAAKAEVESIIDRLGFQIVAVTPTSARRIAEAYRRWGRGLHPAALNSGDCFAYDVAKEHACRLIYVGNDFAKTDIESVL